MSMRAARALVSRPRKNGGQNANPRESEAAIREDGAGDHFTPCAAHIVAARVLRKIGCSRGGRVARAAARTGSIGECRARPTTNTVDLGGVTFSVVFFGLGLDPSVITDFNGFVGVADVQGTGTATNPDGSTEKLLFDTDMRFMSGAYIGQDGAVHKGTFG